MTFRKYICTKCFKAFPQEKLITDCPKCGARNSLQCNGEFERKQPWAKKIRPEKRRVGV